jgi:hypothetical protein
MTRWSKRQELIVREWDRWTERQHIARRSLPARETLKFYTELQNARSPLLEFNSRGRDKWKIVHDWLLAAGRVIE